MAVRILILGGGFGGLTTAVELAERLGADRGHEIVLIDRRDSFVMGLRKLWVLVGQARLDEGRRPLARLNAPGVRIVRAEIIRIDAEARRVVTDGGAFDADYLVIALGAEPRPERVPGLVEHGFDLYDAASVQRAAEVVKRLDRGQVVMAIAGVPYKCPPAPYEAMMLLDDHWRGRRVRDQLTLRLRTMQPMLLPNAGPEGARWMGEELRRRGIAFDVGQKLQRLEAGRLVYESGPVDAALALVAPPHGVPAVVKESGLTGGGEWIAVDPGTLATRVPGVFAIGDATHIPLANQMPLPKAGVMAEAHGRRVAAAIAADVTGQAAPPPFDGRGFCFVETGGGEAAALEGSFYAEPAPAVVLREPSPGGLDAKRRFESERLTRWFGPSDA